MNPDQVVVRLLMWETCGGTVAPMSPEWVSPCSASETSLGCEVCEHNDKCGAFEVLGQGLVKRLALFLEDWELGRVALSCHMTVAFLSRNAGCVLGELRVAWEDSLAEAWVGSLDSQLSQQVKAFLSPWTGCDRKERDVVRELKGKR